MEWTWKKSGVLEIRGFDTPLSSLLFSDQQRNFRCGVSDGYV